MKTPKTPAPLSFVMVVEARHAPGGEAVEARLFWIGESPPDLIFDGEGRPLVKVGNLLASPGDRYGYRPATVMDLSRGLGAMSGQREG